MAAEPDSGMGPSAGASFGGAAPAPVPVVPVRKGPATVVVVALTDAELLPYRHPNPVLPLTGPSTPAETAAAVGTLTINQQTYRDDVFGNAKPGVVVLRGAPGTGKTTVAVGVPGLRYEYRSVFDLMGHTNPARMRRVKIGCPPSEVGWVVVEDATRFDPEFFDALDGGLRVLRSTELTPFGGVKLVLLERDGAWVKSPVRLSKQLKKMACLVLDEFPDVLRVPEEEFEYVSVQK